LSYNNTEQMKPSLTIPKLIAQANIIQKRFAKTGTYWSKEKIIKGLIDIDMNLTADEKRTYKQMAIRAYKTLEDGRQLIKAARRIAENSRYGK
jgi:hypothetical protein